MGAGMEFDYERERLDPAIAFYEARSARSKRWFYVLQGTQLVAATLVTALAAWPGERCEAIVSSEHVAWAAAMERVRTKPAEAST